MASWPGPISTHEARHDAERRGCPGGHRRHLRLVGRPATSSPQGPITLLQAIVLGATGRQRGDRATERLRGRCPRRAASRGPLPNISGRASSHAPDVEPGRSASRLPTASMSIQHLELQLRVTQTVFDASVIARLSAGRDTAIAAGSRRPGRRRDRRSDSRSRLPPAAECQGDGAGPRGGQRRCGRPPESGTEAGPGRSKSGNRRHPQRGQLRRCRPNSRSRAIPPAGPSST